METTHIGFPPMTVMVFALLAIAAFIIDLRSHKDDKPISLKNASLWSVFWIAVSLAFAGYLYLEHGQETASLFITGYALEKVLSIDNLFVFMAIFAWFNVPDSFRHRILYWGIIGAILFRAVFVVIGTSLLSFGPWVELGFAGIVAWTAVMMLRKSDDDTENEDYSNHIAYRFTKKLFPIWPKLHGHNFFVRRKEIQSLIDSPENKTLNIPAKAKIFATPLLLCLAVIEVSDVMFAFDSVPAVIAVSKEPLIVYSAMLFAILGLRTLYFVLDALKRYLVHLEKAVIALLFFIAAKLAINSSEHIMHHGFSIDANISLIIVLTTLLIGIVASLIFPDKEIKEA